MRKKVIFLIGIIVLSMFLFVQPIKAENEIIGIYPVEVVSGAYADLDVYAHWDSDGLLDVESYGRIDGTGLNFQDSYDFTGIRKSIIYLQFDIPNNTKEIKSIKLRLYEMYYAPNYLNDTDIVPLRVEMVNNSWNYDIENVITHFMNWSKRPEGMGIITLTEWSNLTTIGYKYIELVSFVDYIENGTLSFSVESLLNRTHSLSFWSREYADSGGSITKVPTLIIEYKKEPPEPIPPNPFTLTSDADTPDINGLFTLYWISSENADNYSVYKDDVLLNSGLIYPQYYMEIILNGNYDFKVIAFNEYGNTTSNEITVNIEIPPPPPPNPFVLTSDANNPDMDGIFTLYWTGSTHANSYSVYQNDILMDNGLTELYYDVGIYTDGSYSFKIKAFNDYGNMSSNEITVNIEIPLPSPTPFTLTSNADNPDIDGIFMLYWSSSGYADVYSVYYDGVLLEWGITELYCNINVYASGSYDFKVVALNDYGQVDSNIITVNVDIYIVEPGPSPIGENDSGIPFIIGFGVGLGVLGLVIAVGVIFYMKKVRGR
ncbi:hypothetical protein LCGC14_2101100 [marine sediment metagenome]|uniref:DNRLRE domain-containing protein n=1 Tax=marine sediment metagenome TaxID=412755 RepID=A0A0F9EA31_9ZZZZ